jgi:hypothetical protein
VTPATIRREPSGNNRLRKINGEPRRRGVGVDFDPESTSSICFGTVLIRRLTTQREKRVVEKN